MKMVVDLIIQNACIYEHNQLSSPMTLVINKGGILKIEASALGLLFDSYKTHHLIDAKGSLLSVGLIDCHTHLIFAGDRADEFEMRLNGSTYEEILIKGGGIKSTVKATRKASFDELYQLGKARLISMIKQGCLGFEIKSGYGLDLETECKMLKVARQLSLDLDISISTTYLGAHTLPEEYKGRSLAYITYICKEVLPKISEGNLADSVDVFCESVGFSLNETKKVFDAALALGFDIKCHAEQRSSMGASFLASSKGALSCDHLEHIDERSIIKMKEEGTVAVLLPGAFYFLNDTHKPPVELLRKHKVPMAIATDFNPGSSPTNALPLMMNMACLLFGLTVEEAWEGVTLNAAKALGQNMPLIKEGAKATFVLWPFKNPVDLVATFGQRELPQVFIEGQKQTY